jgi:amino acid transporter
VSIKEIPSPDEEPPAQDPGLALSQRLRRVVFGKPLASEQSESNETLLRKLIALPVFCSDAISSVAYGNQAILLVLCSSGLWLSKLTSLYGQYTMTISWLILSLLVIVAASYWQTIYAYPNGGGSYIVSRKNLGTNFGLVAAAALLIDYVLTVSVSVASGLQNIKDVPELAFLHIGHHLVFYCVGAIALITFANLRGLRESGTLFAVPVYTFITMCYLLVLVGIFGPAAGWQFHPEYANQVIPASDITAKATETFSLVVLLRAFANGCSAMTGTEAVSNGIPAFREPKSANAAITLIIMAAILGSVFMGVSWLAVHFHVVYWERDGLTAPAVIDQLSGTVFGKSGPWSWAYVLTQASTAMILIVAAQTSFAGFPRLASILATDGFMPRQLTNLGDKLAFNNGIILLGAFSSAVIIFAKGSVDKLIPFFAIGVFVAFTLSQTGMVRHWFSLKSAHWQAKATINGIGALACFIVVIDIAAEKFFDGAWFVIVMICLLLFMFKRIAWHYTRIAALLSPANYHHGQPMQNTVLVLINGVHAGTLTAIEYARSISKDCTAVSVANEPEQAERLRRIWEEYVPDLELVILDSPFRSLVIPIMRYLDSVHAAKPKSRITVVITEFVTHSWWQSLLHNNTGLILKLALLNRRDVIVANVRYWLEEG